ncbi:MAG TPA: hypothetical protein PLN31_12380 [Azoarcus taiwanensis]|nr:hypothetical protein [Azoarcus taiwanensis]
MHIVLLALARLGAFQDTPLEGFGMTLVLVPYFLHGLGLPVLMDDGLAGWGRPYPNGLGWFLSAISWLSLYMIAAIGVERLAWRSR